MLAKVFSGATIGVDGVLIEVEVDVATRGFPTFTIVGLPNKAIDEAKDRVRTAVVYMSFEMPDSRITVNLAPANIPKTGSSFDLPIAVGILAASGLIERERLGDSLFIGELSLEGQLRSVSGIISIALMAKENGIRNLFIPLGNVQETCLIDDVTIYPVHTLLDLVLHLNKERLIVPFDPDTLIPELTIKGDYLDLKDVKGQDQAKRALEIAAAGFHNLHLVGTPGTGKTLLSRAFPSILPPMAKSEIIDVSKIYSVAGLANGKKFPTVRPFRTPHHTTSRIGLIGGGSDLTPGEISLAHRGVLFLDEFPEFTRSVLESLRQPMEDGCVTISRASGSVTFPARFLFLAASNPCPCGYLGHPKKRCCCSVAQVARYRKRVSGPLTDRIDLQVHVPMVEQEKLFTSQESESSSVVQQRVVAAQVRQQQRLTKSSIKTNAEMSPNDIKRFCHLSPEAVDLLKIAVTRLSLSARSYFKTIKVAQTIADLAGADHIEKTYVAEALQFRTGEE